MDQPFEEEEDINVALGVLTGGFEPLYLPNSPSKENTPGNGIAPPRDGTSRVRRTDRRDPLIAEEAAYTVLEVTDSDSLEA